MSKQQTLSKQQKAFVDLVTDLVGQVKSWTGPHEWVAKEYSKRMRHGAEDIFEVPALQLQKGPVRLLLDPIAYDVPGTEGVVDLYMMPTYDDAARFSFANGAWTIRYASPERDKKKIPLSDHAVNKVLDTIASHDAPSF